MERRIKKGVQDDLEMLNIGGWEKDERKEVKSGLGQRNVNSGFSLTYLEDFRQSSIHS